MRSSLNEKIVREYLLGRVSDETTLEGIEELLFTDEEFCSRVELMEDGIINDYVRGRLNEADAESFTATLHGDPERRARVEFTEAVRAKALARDLIRPQEKASLMASLGAFLRQPKYVGAFAVLVIAVIALAIYFSRKSKDELAELRSIYQQARPTETRIAEFGYAPLPQLRGAPEPGNQNQLRRIENSLIDATEQTPNAQTHHELGVFFLTQQKYGDAITEFQTALKFADNAKIHNDLGVAYFELARSKSREQRAEELARSHEEFTKATELDPSLLEALFNKSLALQELSMPREARKSWNLYLQKDPSSPWADEGRKHLARIESGQARFKTNEQVLSDFLAAFRNREEARVKEIHNDTKGLLSGPMIPLQLSRIFLEAKQRDNETEAQESVEAMSYLGNLEQQQNGESFVSELAKFYAHVRTNKVERLLQAQDTFARGQEFIEKKNTKSAISEFESSRDLFTELGDEGEAAFAETWAVQLLPDIGEVAESRRRWSAMIANAEARKFMVLLPPAYYWLGIGDYNQNRLSESARNLKTALRLAEAGNNSFEVEHAEEALALNYSNIGDLGPALFYASKMLSEDSLYYESIRQSRRNLGTLAFLSLKLKLLSTSLSLSREHLSITQENWLDNSSHLNDSLRRLIDAATAKEDFLGALKYAEESMRIALAHESTPENTRNIANIHLLIADLKSRTKDWNAALLNYEQALDLYSRFPEVTNSLYQSHKGKLFCFRQLDRKEEFSNELKIVLKLADDYRVTVREDDSRQAFFTNEQVVFDMATAFALEQHDSREAFELGEAAKARSLLEFVKSEKPIAAVESDYASVVKSLLLPEIQTRLPEHLQFVQYAVLPDKLAIWTVSKTRFDLLEKQITATELEDKVDAYQALIAEKAPPAEVKQAAQDLYHLLIPSDLARDRQLCLVPDKSLHQLAFATLVSPEGKYLLEDFTLFYAPSASVMVLATENAQRREQVKDERLLSIGNPDFDREENSNLPDLADAETEARTIAASYRKSMSLFGGEATKEEFLRRFGRVEVIHFAGHFVANQQSPGNSKLLFSGGDLRSSELAAYKLPLAKLVVLSSCETFLERYNKSEGAIGIARTLLALGAPVVLASQWKVDSAPTKDLMIAFHRNRRERRMTSAESLRQAQLEMLSKSETAAPFYWAAFSLFGGYANY